MINNKDSLKKLLSFITELSSRKENAWFKDELCKTIGVPNVIAQKHIGGDVEAKIALIQEYLKIDFIDIVDYSGFDEKVSDQLLRDCIEMGRHKKGTVNHKIDFLEYTKFAHFQFEELTNYYLNKKYSGNISNIKEVLIAKIDKKNNGYEFVVQRINKAISISAISFKDKFDFVKRDLGLEFEIINTIEFSARIRNEISHRSSLEDKQENITMDQYNKRFPKNFIDKNTAVSSDWKLFNEGKYILFKRSYDFNKVFNTLISYKNNILKDLKPITKEDIKDSLSKFVIKV